MNYCGVLNIDKPEGLTSREIVNHVDRLVRPAKVGHAGTLDPLATGVLVVCVGHATRLVTLAQEGRKRYLARFELGKTSDTDDITGTVDAGGEWTHLTEDDITRLLPLFTGRIAQVPPQFSAVHVKGERAYHLARRGETVEIEARPVDVYSLRLTEFQLPGIELEIECGSGTYVRSIGRDLGHRLGCGAVMTKLRRTAVGPFEVSDAITLDSLTPETIAASLQPALRIAQHLPQRVLSPQETVSVRRGQAIRLGIPLSVFEEGGPPQTSEPPCVPRAALVDADEVLIGIGEVDFTTSRLHPRIIFPN
ncbi:tRNA pseudouridine(55) synthase TruB [Schlesneria sp. DSM 10557]|uniref:tRNA pseudouridine(55) synthase TruB n=1 Tax=Schlesneria sp. DSM 10557 TaxID=3044399 RepID=UPI0035A03AD9